MVRRVVIPKDTLSRVLSGFSQKEYHETTTMSMVGRYPLRTKWPIWRWKVKRASKQEYLSDCIKKTPALIVRI